MRTIVAGVIVVMLVCGCEAKRDHSTETRSTPAARAVSLSPKAWELAVLRRVESARRREAAREASARRRPHPPRRPGNPPDGKVENRPLVSRLTATPISTPAVTLSWSCSGPEDAEILIQRSEDGAAWSNLQTVSGGAHRYTDLAIRIGHTYAYRLRPVSAHTPTTWSTSTSAVTL